MALVSLPLIWMILIAVAFTFVFWSTGSLKWQKSFETSASSLTTLGFSEPAGTFGIAVAFIEATIGLGLVALLISYLPTIYSAYNNREKGIVMLSPLAGTPPSVPRLIQTLHRTGALEATEFWRNQTDWAVDLEQTHSAFPILTYFPEAHANLSWVATLGTVLDTAALVVSVSETDATRVLADAEKGPLMALVFGIPTVDRVARAANVPLEPAPSLLDVTARLADPPPAVSVSRHEFLDAARPGTPHPRTARRDRRRRCLATVRLAALGLRPSAPCPGRHHPGALRPLDHRSGRPGWPAPVPAAPPSSRGMGTPAGLVTGARHTA